MLKAFKNTLANLLKRKSLILINILSFSLGLANITFEATAQTAKSSEKVPYGNNPAAGKYFTSGDAKLYYEIYGNGEPLLLLHGGVYGYIEEFEFLIPKLAENHKVICLATRGHGKSEIGKEPYSYNKLAEDANNLLKHLNINKAIVVGFSDGGYVGFKLAALYPERVTKLVAMGAGDMQNAKREVFNYSEEKLMKESRNYFAGRRKLMPEPDRWNESLKMLNNMYNNDSVSQETFSKIKCPVLVMAGDGDEYSNTESVVSVFRQIKGAKLSIIPACGHVILYCNFPAVWESMKNFVYNAQGKQ